MMWLRGTGSKTFSSVKALREQWENLAFSRELSFLLSQSGGEEGEGWETADSGMVSKDTEGIVLLYWSFIVHSSKDVGGITYDN